MKKAKKNRKGYYYFNCSGPDVFLADCSFIVSVCLLTRTQGYLKLQRYGIGIMVITGEFIGTATYFRNVEYEICLMGTRTQWYQVL